MATIAAPIARPNENWFFVGMAALCALVAFGGFAGTYWLQLLPGTFTGSPLLHLHGLLFSAWTLLFLSQAILIASRRYRPHRTWGVIGVSLATAMVFTGMAVAIAGLNARLAAGHGDAARAFSIVPMTAVLVFAGLVVAALVNVRRQDWHKRLMFVATAALLQPAIVRFFFLARTGGGPGVRPGQGPPQIVENTLVAAGLAMVPVILGMIYDWRRRGRPHPAYLWGIAVLVGVQLFRLTLDDSPAWLATADFLARFSG